MYRLTRQWRPRPCQRRACHRWRTWGTRRARPPALSRPPRRCPAVTWSSLLLSKGQNYYLGKGLKKCSIFHFVQQIKIFCY